MNASSPEGTDLLPTVRRWFDQRVIDSTVSVITEPYVHPFLRSNIWHIRGGDRDLIVDTGLGVGSLRGELPHLFLRNPVVVITHGHLDHAGGAHEFDECLAHPAERIDFPQQASLDGAKLIEQLGLDPDRLPGPLPGSLLSARPTPDYVVERYRLLPVSGYGLALDDTLIDLGDRQMRILHVPGHSPGSVAVFDESNASLFSGDLVYCLGDGEKLLDEVLGANVDDYIASLRRIASLPVRTTYPGHGAVLDRNELDEVIRRYLRLRRRHGCLGR